jgi:hypothetical protein
MLGLVNARLGLCLHTGQLSLPVDFDVITNVAGLPFGRNIAGIFARMVAVTSLPMRLSRRTSSNSFSYGNWREMKSSSLWT